MSFAEYRNQKTTPPPVMRLVFDPLTPPPKQSNEKKNLDKNPAGEHIFGGFSFGKKRDGFTHE